LLLPPPLLLLLLLSMTCLCLGVPPGHYLMGTGSSAMVTKWSNGDLQAGQAGSYQPSWLDPADPAAASCISCGSGILSANIEPLPVYSDGLDNPSMLNVAQTSIACCECAARDEAKTCSGICVTCIEGDQPLASQHA
jgi:hypothetical protein